MVLSGNPYRAILRREYPDPFIALLAFVLGIWLWDHYFGKAEGYAPGTEEVALVKMDRDLRLADAMRGDGEWLRRLAAVDRPAVVRDDALAVLEELAREKSVTERGMEAYAVLKADKLGVPPRTVLEQTLQGRALPTEQELAQRVARGKVTWWEMREYDDLSGAGGVAAEKGGSSPGRERWEAGNRTLRVRAVLARTAVWLIGALGLIFLPRALRQLSRTFTTRARGYGGAWPLPLGLAVFLGATLAWIGFSSVLELGISTLPGVPPILAIFLDSAARLLPTMIALGWLFRRPQHALRVMGFLRPLEGRTVLGVFALLMILDQGLHAVFGQAANREPGGGLSMGDAGGWGLAYALISACILAPFAEETLYRGILFRAFWNRVGVVPAALVSSLVFAVLHFYDGYGLASVGLFGFTCALLYAGTGSLRAVIVLHMLYNSAIKIPEWIVYHMPL